MFFIGGTGGTAPGLGAINIDLDGNVGIGTDDPTAKLDVAGNLRVTGFKLIDNNQGPGKLLQSDANGNATWADPPPTDDGDWTVNGDDIYRNVENGNVGIGTDDPTAKLDVGGKVKAQEFQLLSGAPGLDKLLRSDEYGNATWATPRQQTMAIGLLAAIMYSGMAEKLVLVPPGQQQTYT